MGPDNHRGKYGSERTARMATTLQSERAESPSEDGSPLGGVECRLVEPSEGAAWNRYVDSSSDANLGHRFEWRAALEDSYRKSCYYLAAFREGECVGILPLVHMRGFFADGRLVSLPFLDQAGVLAESPAVARKLAEEACSLAREIGAKGVEIRALAADGVQESERVTLVLDLPATTDELWKSFKPKVRNQVRKSEKGGLVVRRSEPERLGDFYRVFCENMRDLGSPVHGRRFLESVLSTFGNAAWLYLTEDSTGSVVGGAIALRDGDRITVPWASSLRGVFKWCPNHCLYWRILQDCVEDGATSFDFGRSWVGAGTYRFKTQWGATDRPLDWSALDEAGEPVASGGIRPGDHSLVVRVWSRLPLSIANSVGPIIRRQLSN
jgi:FemAB-related protein (PEP-CTERM system-associated)